MLIAVLGVTGATARTLTLPAGWTIAVEVGAPPTNPQVHIAWKIADGTEAGASFSLSGTSPWVMQLYEYSGIQPNPVDQTDTNTGSSATSLAVASGASHANSLAVVGVMPDSSVDSAALTDGFTLDLPSVTPVRVLLAGTKEPAGSASTTASWTNSREVSGVMATFKGA